MDKEHNITIYGKLYVVKIKKISALTACEFLSWCDKHAISAGSMSLSHYLLNGIEQIPEDKENNRNGLKVDQVIEQISAMLICGRNNEDLEYLFNLVIMHTIINGQSGLSLSKLNIISHDINSLYFINFVLKLFLMTNFVYDMIDKEEAKKSLE
jgi:hypothetical protein